MDLMVQRGKRMDRAHRANSEPLICWAKHVFSNNPQHNIILAKAWRRQIKSVGLDPMPWKRLRGPAGAAIATLGRIGWKSAAYDS